MIYTINIDWLAVHCHYCPPRTSVNESEPETARPGNVDEWEPVEAEGGDMFAALPWRYKLAEYGTRQFSRLHFVRMRNAAGGWDDFAEVQSCPHSGILNRSSVIVRFVNRALYLPDFWELANRLLSDNNFVFVGISRIDICADFNQFKCMSPLSLIESFAAKKLRHIGKGVGALYFNHGIGAEKDAFGKPSPDYGVQYTGLSFGTHSSDLRVYLYNKTFELDTQGDKPWIRDTWKAVGLDIRNVWRLEVSIKSKGCSFKDKITGKVVDIDITNAANDDELSKIFHTFALKKFAFVKNHRGIKNISREPRLQLFNLHPIYAHKTIRNVSPGNKFERMFLKALYQLGDLYRGADVHDDALTAQSLAYDIADATDLSAWLAKKIPEWEKPTHK